MLAIDSARYGWKLLEPKDKTDAFRLLVVIILAAIANAIMIASIWLFLDLVMNPDKVQVIGIYSRVYEYFAFTSVIEFTLFAGVFSTALIIISTAIQVFRVYKVSKFSLSKSHTLSARLVEKYLNSGYEFHIENNSSKLET